MGCDIPLSHVQVINCSYFDIKVCYPPAVQVVESFKNISEVESHFLLCQVSPAHYVVQETALVRPDGAITGCIRVSLKIHRCLLQIIKSGNSLLETQLNLHL